MGLAMAPALIVLALCAPLIDNALHYSNTDDADYFLLAQGLTHGRGYSDYWLAQPRPHTRFPPATAALAAAVFTIAGPRLLAVKVLFSLMAAGAAAALVLLAGHPGRPAPWLALAGMSAPVVAWYSTQLLSEAPYLGFSLLALAAYELFEARSRANADRAGAGLDFKGLGLAAISAVLAVSAVLTRLIGVTLAAALGIAFLRLALVHRPSRPAAGLAMLIITLGVAAWPAGNRLRSGAAAGEYANEMFMVNPRDPDQGRVSPLRFIVEFPRRLAGYAQITAGQTFLPTGESKIPAAATVPLLAFALVGLAARLRRLHPLAIYLVLYFALLGAWSFCDSRLTAPVIPVVAVVFLEGLDLAIIRLNRGGRWSDRTRRTALIAAALALLGSHAAGVAGLGLKLAHERKFGGAVIDGNIRVRFPHAGMASFYQSCHQAGEAAGDGKALMSRKPALAALASGRPAAAIPLAEPDRLLQIIDHQQVGYVVTDKMWPESERCLIPAIRQYPRRFQLLACGPDEITCLYRVNP